MTEGAATLTWPEAQAIAEAGGKIARAHWDNQWIQLVEGELRLCSLVDGAVLSARPVLGGNDVQSADWRDVSGSAGAPIEEGA